MLELTMIKADPIGSRKSKWGEGPVWYQHELIYVDIESHEIVCFNPTTKTQVTYNVGQRIGFTVPCTSGKLLYGGDKGLFYFDRSAMTSRSIIDPESQKEDNRFNDGKVSPRGDLYAGTISLVKKTGDAKLYHLSPDLKLKVAYEPVTNSNGLAWSENKKVFYYIDTPSREIKAFDFKDNGRLENMRCVVDTSKIEASPDGMCIDNHDTLWVAFCHGGCVVNYDPVSGKEIRRIAVQALETTSCAFGGLNGNDLYITTGVHKTQKEEWGGSLFVVRDLDVSAPPAKLFEDS